MCTGQRSGLVGRRNERRHRGWVRGLWQIRVPSAKRRAGGAATLAARMGSRIGVRTKQPPRRVPPPRPLRSGVQSAARMDMRGGGGRGRLRTGRGEGTCHVWHLLVC